MLLQNLHHRYLYLVIQLPHLKDLDQKLPSFPNCDNYGMCRASNPNPLNDDTKTNDNELHQQLCITFKMDLIMKVKTRLECKISITLLALLPNKIVQDSRGPATSSEKTGHEEQDSRQKSYTITSNSTRYSSNRQNVNQRYKRFGRCKKNEFF